MRVRLVAYNRVQSWFLLLRGFFEQNFRQKFHFSAICVKCCVAFWFGKFTPDVHVHSEDKPGGCSRCPSLVDTLKSL